MATLGKGDAPFWYEKKVATARRQGGTWEGGAVGPWPRLWQDGLAVGMPVETRPDLPEYEEFCAAENSMGVYPRPVTKPRGGEPHGRSRRGVVDALGSPHNEAKSSEASGGPDPCRSHCPKANFSAGVDDNCYALLAS